MKKILILEDNPLAVSYLQKIVNEVDPRNMVYSYNNVSEAYRCAMEQSIDLFLIDIILDLSNSRDVSGLKFADNIRRIEHYKFIPIVFITSLEDVKSYSYEKIHCYEFIEKPFDEDQVKKTIEQCLMFTRKSDRSKTLFFRVDGVLVAVNREDLVYAESIKHIIHIHDINGCIIKVPYFTVKKFLEEVESSNIIQCSRSTVVNVDYIKDIDIPNQTIRLKGNYEDIPIGRTYKKQIRDCFG